MEGSRRGRPTEENKITKTMAIVLEGKLHGQPLIDNLDSAVGVNPHYRDAILGAMNCFDSVRGSLLADPLSHCAECPFGPGEGNTRTLCTEYSIAELDPNRQYVVLPDDYNRYSHSLNVSNTKLSIAMGVDELEEHGYISIPRKQISKVRKDNGLGFSNDSSEVRRNSRNIMHEIYRFGLKAPYEFDILGLLDTGDEPVVAKRPGVHNGKLKFLLENVEQKTNFLSWMYVCSNAGMLFNMFDDEQIVGMINDIKESMNPSNKNIFMDIAIDHFDIQEYVAGPTDYASSLRVLVSGYGDILYSECLISPIPNSERSLVVDNYKELKNPIEIVAERCRKSNKLNYNMFELLLTHPDSPLFLDTKNIVSNFSNGSRSVPLEGEPINNPWMSEQLSQLGHDPSNPRLPDYLKSISRQIGITSRFVWPYTGIDWIPSYKSGKYMFMEANTPPALAKEMMPDSTPATGQLALQSWLLRNIAKARRTR